MPAATILIIAPREDVHAQTMAAAAARHDARALIFDSAGIPSVDRVALRFGSDRAELHIRAADFDLSFDDVRSVWWRRPLTPHVAEVVTEDRARQFCVRESEALFRGALDATGVPVVNDPAAQARAARKPLQLAVARIVGLTVPRTVMSNDPDQIRQLWEETAGECVYKTFTAPAWRAAETRRLTKDVLADLDTLRHAPVIAQELIEGRDLRATVIGDRIFTAAADTRLPAGRLDGRLDRTATWYPHDLPDETSRGLLRLTRKLGLDYGCIDLRQQPDGGYVFLEINPAGQFLFVEIDTGLPLIRTLMELLLAPRRDLMGTSKA
jgi:glutathione synthase/RimK-type ligase-like ATP-grasp enzyme